MAIGLFTAPFYVGWLVYSIITKTRQKNEIDEMNAMQEAEGEDEFVALEEVTATEED